MKITLKSLTMATAISLCALPALATERVAIGVPSWTGAQAIAHLLGAVVEMRIGGEVEYVPGNNATIFQSMPQGPWWPSPVLSVRSKPWAPKKSRCAWVRVAVPRAVRMVS